MPHIRRIREEKKSIAIGQRGINRDAGWWSGRSLGCRSVAAIRCGNGEEGQQLPGPECRWLAACSGIGVCSGWEDVTQPKTPHEHYSRSRIVSKALLMIEHLLWTGLARVDNGLTSEMVWLNVLGRSHGGPPVQGSRLPRGWAGGSLREGAATPTGAQDASITPVAEKSEKLTENARRDSGAWIRGGQKQ